MLAGEMTLDGGLVTLNGQEFTGNVQLGLSNGKPDAADATVAAATVVVKGHVTIRLLRLPSVRRTESG